MKKTAIPSLILITVFSLAVFAGCAPKGDFSYSDGISDTGYWKGVKALKKVELCEYTGISVPSDVHAIADESVQAEIDSIVSGYTTEEQITDRAVADGDTVNIDYVGSVDGVEFEGGSTGGQGTEVTIGVTQYIDDFLEQLIGHSPGESFDIEVTFPEDYGVEDLNGKDAVFAITVNHIVNTVVPELTDDFVADNLSGEYGWGTVDEMKEEIRSGQQQIAVSQYVQEYVIDNTAVNTIPKALLTHQKDLIVDYYQGLADSYGMELNEFLSANMEIADTEELLTEFQDDIAQAATVSLVMQAVAEDLAISITDEDVAAFFVENMGTEDYTEYETEYGLPYLKMVVLQKHVVDYLTENAVLA